MSLKIHLDSGTALEPGSEIRGKVEWQTAVERPKSVVISLLWHTEGKGTEDIEIIEQIEVEDPPVSGSRDFSFTLPDFPWSFSGTLVSLIWRVEASIEPGGVIEYQNLVSAPGGEEIRI
ncbi:MAG: hypothetical protein V3T72_22520 [Thermoanaerobaculia bacterium]